MHWISKFLGDQRGGTLIEYGLIVALIVIVMFASLSIVAGTTIRMWNNVSAKVQQSG